MKARGGVAWRLRPPCQDFAASMPATRGLIAGPWTPLASLCCRGALLGAPVPAPSWSPRLLQRWP
jgi:hypothetical protein